MSPNARTSSFLGAVAMAVVINACSSMPPAGCASDSQCASGQVCRDGACAMAVSAECTAGETRPCGNAAIGACRRGTQACENGVFATACSGEVRPGAETCNSVDDDCDGEVDEGLAMAWFADADGDGFGAASANPQMACQAPLGFVSNSDDCDDRAGAGSGVHPGATELCDAVGVDENCNGTANEGCACTTVGAMTPCCSGRGTQTCQGTGMLSACSAGVSAESCNGIDDDCDGQIDEQPQFSFDGGSTCSVGVGACAQAGTATCMGGLQICSGAGGTPSSELCNGIDDDCDGTTDEDTTITQADGGAQLDGGLANPDGSCVVGIGACARTGATGCTAAALTCTATPGTPQVEVCNAIDDDCDGTVDEPGQGLCAVSGQLCLGGACACPSGQSVCNSACVTLSTEVCDGIDNDCDGQTDEALQMNCVADADGDLYADSAVVVSQCPDPSRTAAGFCPAGLVAPANSLGTDCNPTVGSLYRLVSSRTDADGDTACTGAAANDCVGSAALPGRRFASSCNVIDDCNDTTATLFHLASSRNDADGDTFCSGAASNDCVGALPLAGRRFASTCNTLSDDCNDSNPSSSLLTLSRNDVDGDGVCAGAATNDCTGTMPLPGRRFASSCPALDDCNDTNGSLYRLMNARADADADTFCTGAVVSECSGANPNPGRRFEAACQTPDDCNDANGTIFRIASVRADADGDTWCAGSATNQCIGNSPPAGLRIATSCAGDDCRDTNSQATSICTLTNQYTTTFHTQTCPQGATNFSLTVTGFCPIGFTLGSYRPEVTAGLGQCAVANPTTITQTCNVFEGSTCRIVGDCVAQ